MNGMSGVRRPRGIYIALGLLTLCAVFAATAGVREALATNTQALRQTLSSSPSLAKTITVSTTADSVSRAMAQAQLPADLTEGQLGEITSQLHADYDHGVVSLAPPGADWASMTSNVGTVASPLPKVGGTEVKLEVAYKQPLSQHMRLVAGHFPGAPAPPVPVPGEAGSNAAFGFGGSRTYAPLLPVVVTQQTATTFGLRVGSKVRVPAGGVLGGLAMVTLQVSGIVAPTDPDSAFWTSDQAAAIPSLQNQGSLSPPPYWVGGVIAGPGEAHAVQDDFGSGDLAMGWGLPLTFGSITGQQAQPLNDALTSITAQTPALSGDVAPVASTLHAACSLLTVLAAYFTSAQSVQALLWLLYVSLTVTGLAVLLLAARMVAMRRTTELTVVRARGASLWQVGLMAAGAAAALCIPAAVIGVGLAVIAVPGAGSLAAESAGGWWPPAAVLAFAICGPALTAAWQHRLPRHRGVRPGHQPRARVRLVVEVTLAAAAVAGIVVFRKQSTVPGAGVNLYTSAAPVLVAVPAVIIAARIYPFVLRGLLRASARSAGAPAFLGLARAVRNSLTPALPAFALVLALTVAAFAGMVRDAVTNGDAAASWKAAGADVTISGQSGFPGFAMPPAAVRALSAVPGVTHAAAGWSQAWLSANGTQLTVLAVDPASYAALVAAVPGAPAVAAGSLAVAPTGVPQPVLASPSAAASLGTGATSISTSAAVHPVRVRVAGVVSATPGWPGGGAFLIMPLSVLKSTATPPTPIPVTELLLTGAGIDRARLTTVLHRVLPAGGTAFFRADVLSGLTNQPLQHGAFVLFTLSVALAAVLGLAVMFLELALGAAERQSALARLATMGLGERQRAWVVALEVLPAVIAAAVAAWACALVLPQVVGPAIDLSVFTSTSLTVPLAPTSSGFFGAVPLVPDVAAVVLPLGGLIVVAGVALWIEIRSGRRHGVTTALRIGG
jgi:putative ABC transport system permease protein